MKDLCRCANPLSPTDIYCPQCGLLTVGVRGFGSTGVIEEEGSFTECYEKQPEKGKVAQGFYRDWEFEYVPESIGEGRDFNQPFLFKIMESAAFKENTCNGSQYSITGLLNETKKKFIHISGPWDPDNEAGFIDTRLGIFHPYLTLQPGSFRLLPAPRVDLDFGCFTLGETDPFQCYAFWRQFGFGKLALRIPVRINTNQPRDYKFTVGQKVKVTIAGKSKRFVKNIQANEFQLYERPADEGIGFAETTGSFVDGFVYLEMEATKEHQKDLDFDQPLELAISLGIKGPRLFNPKIDLTVIALKGPQINFEDKIVQKKKLSVRDEFTQDIRLVMEPHGDWQRMENKNLANRLKFPIRPIRPPVESMDNWLRIEREETSWDFTLEQKEISCRACIKVPLGQIESTPTNLEYSFFLDVLNLAGDRLDRTDGKIEFQKLQAVNQMVAFDFGTCNTCAAFWPIGAEHPSLLYWGNEGSKESDEWVASRVVLANVHEITEATGWFSGMTVEERKRQYNYDPDGNDTFVFHDFKKKFQEGIDQTTGVERKIDFHDVHLNHGVRAPSEALLGVLKSFIREAEKNNNLKINRLGFTFPTKWSFETVKKYYQTLQKMAGELGIEVAPPDTDEGTAVLLDYFNKQDSAEKKKKKIYVSYDLGGGTLDVALMEMWLIEKSGRRPDIHCRMIGYAGNAEFGSNAFTTIIGDMVYALLLRVFNGNPDLLNEVLEKGTTLNRIPSGGNTTVLFPKIDHHAEWNKNLEEAGYKDLQMAGSVSLAYLESLNHRKIQKVAEEIKKGFTEEDIDFYLGELLDFSLVILTRGQEPYLLDVKSMKKRYPKLYEAICKEAFHEGGITIENFLQQRYAFMEHAQQKFSVGEVFQRSVKAIENLIPADREYDGLDIILAGNGSRFIYVEKALGELKDLIEKSGKKIRDVEIKKPGQHAKQSVALGYARRQNFAPGKKIPPVYEVLQNPPFITVTDYGTGLLVNRNIFEQYQRFAWGLLGNDPVFKDLESKDVEIEYDEEAMLRKGCISIDLNLRSDSSICRFTIAKKTWLEFCDSPTEIESSLCRVKFHLKFNNCKDSISNFGSKFEAQIEATIFKDDKSTSLSGEYRAGLSGVALAIKLLDGN